jgi:hypothetical protein
MVGNARRRPGLKGQSRMRLRAARLVRRARLRHTLRAVRKRAGPRRAVNLIRQSPRRACGSAA